MAEEGESEGMFLPPKVVDSIDFAMGVLATHSVELLKLLYNNGSSDVPFSQAYCDVAVHGSSFPLKYLFHHGLRRVFQLRLTNDMSLCSGDMPLENLIKVLDESEDIAERLQKADIKQETAYVVRLAHHLLVPLSQNKTYKMDHHSIRQTKKCDCCNNVITGSFDDTSMGNKSVWHGSTDIMIGKSNGVCIRVNHDDDDDDCQREPASSFETKVDTSENLLAHRNQLIAQTIVFGFLQGNNSDSSLIPTIEITKNYVRIFFYDVQHDFLLESCKMTLFEPDVGLCSSTIIALWLAINYPVTCSGLTELIVGTNFTADFMKHFSWETKEIYRNELKFGNCLKKRCLDEKSGDKKTSVFNSRYSKPYKRKSELLTTEIEDDMEEKAVDVRNRKRLKIF